MISWKKTDLSGRYKRSNDVDLLIGCLGVKNISQWCKDNPDWTRDWSDPSTLPGTGEVGDLKEKLKRSHPGWNDVLHKASKAPGSYVRPI